MNTPMNMAHETDIPSPITPAAMALTRPLYWSIRRELWETRLIYRAPLGASVVFLIVFLLHTILIRLRVHGVWSSSPAQQQDMFGGPYEIAAGLIMGTAFIVGVFYSLEALYAERRDRSILFWKSLPVSDLTIVISKLSVPFVILPLLSFVLTVATQFIMLLLSNVVLLGSGLDLKILWTHAAVFETSGMLFYHIVTVHGLWYAPIYGWLLLVSAWAPRAPFVWAFLPPFVIWGAEKLAFNTSHFLSLLAYRLIGPEVHHTVTSNNLMGMISGLTPLQFFTTPGLWTGLALAAIFVTVAIRLRRYHGPI